MDAFIWPLAHTGKKLISEVPEVVFEFDGSCDSMQYLLGGLLILLGNGLSISLEGLPVFVFKHHLQLLPAGLHEVSFFSVDVMVLKEVNSPGVEFLPVL